MRLRQVVLAARDLDTTVGQLCATLGVRVSYNDPGVAYFGLRNAVMPIGDTFLEVVSPLTPDAAAARYLDRRGGDGGYMVMVQSDDFDADRERIERLGVRLVWSAELDDIKGMHLHPRDIGGAILSLDQPLPAEEWRWAGPDWREHVVTETCSEIVAVELTSPQPEPLAARWAEVLARPISRTERGYEIALERGTIRLSAGETEGVAAFDVHGDPDAILARARKGGAQVDGDQVIIAGVRISSINFPID